MKSRLVLALLGFTSLLCYVSCDAPYECTFPEMMLDEKPFPNIEELSLWSESYEMTVEFTLRGVEQTDFYMEYYDKLNRRGKLEAHQNSEALTYIYRTDTLEAWNIRGINCSLQNVTGIPDLLRDFQDNWIYEVEDKPELRTVGPSAMFKAAYDRWNHKDLKKTMAYMGEMPHTKIRGQTARLWRWCQSKDVSVDYYFTVPNVTDNPYNMPTAPLRVHFFGQHEGELKDLSEQYYDIINYQPFIDVGLFPFELPKGKACGRGGLANPQPVPVLEEGTPVQFYSEVIYRKVKKDTQTDIGTFYSTLMFALDPLFNNMAYRYSPWNTTETKTDAGLRNLTTFLEDTEYTVFDISLGYSYRQIFEQSFCEIGRGAESEPSFTLPEGGGELDIMDPYLFFPNDEFTFLTKGADRGLEVNIFEAVSEGYLMNMFEQAKLVIATHSYLTDDERINNVISTKNAPMQTELRIFRNDDNLEEILTFNFFGYTTKFQSWRRRLFDISRCFKNDDAYSWVTIVFELPMTDPDFKVDPTAVEERLLATLYESDGDWVDDSNGINPSRIPTVMVDVQDGLYVTFLLLEKPPLILDFPDNLAEPGKVVDSPVSEGLSTFDSCGEECLSSSKCWGFSLCSGVCRMGSETVTKTVEDKDCIVYKRYSNESYIKSKGSIIKYWQYKVKDGQLSLKVVNTNNDEEVDLKAVFLSEVNPGEDDETFDKMGNKLSDRMRVVKVGKKLNKGKVLGKLRFDECQRLCLDYEDCESVSYCLIDSVCSITPKYGEELDDADMKDDRLCEIVTRKYADNFDQVPGFIMPGKAKKSIKVANPEECARACLKETGFRCLSVDMCAGTGDNCLLHDTHFIKDTKGSLEKDATCTHHSRKYSAEFKKHITTRVKGTKVTPLTAIGLEECAKACVDYANGGCYGFDFCQGNVATESSCYIIDSDPSRLENIYSSVCTQYLRSETEYSPRPYSNSYAAGIGVLCFVVGGLIGALVIFGIAYIRVNRR